MRQCFVGYYTNHGRWGFLVLLHGMAYGMKLPILSISCIVPCILVPSIIQVYSVPMSDCSIEVIVNVLVTPLSTLSPPL